MKIRAYIHAEFRSVSTGAAICSGYLSRDSHEFDTFEDAVDFFDRLCGDIARTQLEFVVLSPKGTKSKAIILNSAQLANLVPMLSLDVEND